MTSGHKIHIIKVRINKVKRMCTAHESIQRRDYKAGRFQRKFCEAMNSRFLKHKTVLPQVIILREEIPYHTLQ